MLNASAQNEDGVCHEPRIGYHAFLLAASKRLNFTSFGHSARVDFIAFIIIDLKSCNVLSIVELVTSAAPGELV